MTPYETEMRTNTTPYKLLSPELKAAFDAAVTAGATMLIWNGPNNKWSVRDSSPGMPFVDGCIYRLNELPVPAPRHPMADNKIPYGLLSQEMQDVLTFAQEAHATIAYWSYSRKAWRNREKPSEPFQNDVVYRLKSSQQDPLKTNPIVLKIDSLHEARNVQIALCTYPCYAGITRSALDAALAKYVDIETPKD